MASSPENDDKEVSEASMEDKMKSKEPSKVVHFRNFPRKFPKEELIKMCSPFGKVANFICGIGTKKNQALVEFADISEAISLVSHYTSSSNRIQFRGKTIHVEYSAKQKILGKTYSSGNVLLVAFEGAKIKDVSIDVIHSVFDEFGFVQKISMFDKLKGFQTLIQYADNETAASAKNALDGTSIPKYFLPEHVDKCDMRISYSGHLNLNIKLQTKRTRDYTNPSILSTRQKRMQRGKNAPHENHVLCASFENMQSDVNVDDLYEVFSKHGNVKKISKFKRNQQVRVLVQYPDVAKARAAKNALDGYCMYENGCCKLNLSYSRHTNIFVQGSSETARDYTKKDDNVSEEQASNTTSQQNPEVAASMNPNNSHAVPAAQVHGSQQPTWLPMHHYMPVPVPGTFPNQAYAIPPYPYPYYALGQSHPIPMHYYGNYMQPIRPGVPFPYYIQPSYADFLPYYYYGYGYY